MVNEYAILSNESILLKMLKAQSPMLKALIPCKARARMSMVPREAAPTPAAGEGT